MVLPAPFHRPWLGVVATVLLAVYGLLLAAVQVTWISDLWPYYFANPEMILGTRIVRQLPGESGAPRTAHDFDGDGAPDEFDVEYCHMESILGNGTSGLLRVRSGRDSRELLVLPTDTPMTPVNWAGDLDGNGTDDLVVASGERTLQLLHDR